MSNYAIKLDLSGVPIAELLPLVLPPYWREAERRVDGCAYVQSLTGLVVILSANREGDGRRWLHLSVSRRNRLPSWEDLREVKAIFLGPTRKAIQILPPEAEYVNLHPYVLHLWACLDGDPLPDFTQGSGSL